MNFRKFTLGALALGFIFPATVVAQGTNYQLELSPRQVNIDLNTQAKIEILAKNASDQNAAEIKLATEGEVKIISIQGNNETLSLGAQTTDSTAEIDVATTVDFEQEQSLATVIVALTGTEGGRVFLTEGSTIGGETVELSSANISYGENTESNSETDPVVDPGEDPLLLVLIALAALALLGLVVMVITRNRNDASSDFNNPN